jgi:hypothetical protein
MACELSAPIGICTPLPLVSATVPPELPTGLVMLTGPELSQPTVAKRAMKSEERMKTSKVDSVNNRVR